MKKTQAKLLGDSNKDLQYKIVMLLTDKETAEFHYSNRDIAQNHYDSMCGTMNMGGLAIKSIRFETIE